CIGAIGGLPGIIQQMSGSGGSYTKYTKSSIQTYANVYIMMYKSALCSTGFSIDTLNVSDPVMQTMSQLALGGICDSCPREELIGVIQTAYEVN
ncbi:hypothetical protein CYMTET_31794, partial [Cymbomonas tetramitiformis]